MRDGWPGHKPDEWLRCQTCIRIQRWRDLRPAHFKDRPSLLIAVCREPDENCAHWQAELLVQEVVQADGMQD